MHRLLHGALSMICLSGSILAHPVHRDSNLLCADYSMKRANISLDDVSSTSSSTSSVSPADSPLSFSTRQSPRPLPPPLPHHHHAHHQRCLSQSPDHGVAPSSQAVTPPLQPAVAAATTASPTPASRTTSPELLVIPAEPRRRAGSRSKGNRYNHDTVSS